jgi:hypothetical protein
MAVVQRFAYDSDDVMNIQTGNQAGFLVEYFFCAEVWVHFLKRNEAIYIMPR